MAPTQVRNFGNDGGKLNLAAAGVIGAGAKQGTLRVRDSVVLPNLELDSVVAEGVGFLFGGRNGVRFGVRFGLESGVGVEPDFLDLFGDVGDGNRVGFGRALEGEPDRDEEEDEDDGGANADAENHP